MDAKLTLFGTGKGITAAVMKLDDQFPNLQINCKEGPEEPSGFWGGVTDCWHVEALGPREDLETFFGTITQDTSHLGTHIAVQTIEYSE